MGRAFNIYGDSNTLINYILGNNNHSVSSCFTRNFVFSETVINILVLPYIILKTTLQKFSTSRNLILINKINLFQYLKITNSTNHMNSL